MAALVNDDDARTDIAALLSRLVDSYPRRARELRRDLAAAGLERLDIAQSLVRKPARPIQSIPLVATGLTHPLTPMILARFEFAAAIHDLEVHLLDPTEMAAVLASEQFLEVFTSQAENWEGSAPASVPPDRVSIFSIQSLDDGDLTYLVWPENSTTEPALWKYSGQSETTFTDLRGYLTFLCGD